jgi:hypothetical protein
MERSANQRFLEQKRLQPNYELAPNKSNDLPWIISVVGLLSILMLAITVTYLSK